MLTLLMIYTAIFKRDTLGLLRGDVVAGLGYITNWYQIWVGAGYTAQADFAPLRHLWSLAVEEQFYLFWPLIMVGLIRLGRRRLPDISRWLLLAALAIAVVIGVLYPTGVDRHAGHPSGRLLGRRRALDLEDGHAVPVDDHPLDRTVDRRRLRDAVAAGGRHARPAAQQGPRARPPRARSGSPRSVRSRYVPPRDQGRRPRRSLLFRGGFLAVGLATVMVMAAVTHQRRIGGSAARQPRLQLDRHPLVRAVPVPLADLPDHPRHGRFEADRRRVRRRDGRSRR